MQFSFAVSSAWTSTYSVHVAAALTMCGCTSWEQSISQVGPLISGQRPRPEVCAGTIDQDSHRDHQLEWTVK